MTQDEVVHEVFDEFKRQLPDVDPQETAEWVESLDALVDQAGPERARFVLYKLLKRARMLHIGLPPLVQTHGRLHNPRERKLGVVLQNA